MAEKTDDDDGKEFHFSFFTIKIAQQRKKAEEAQKKNVSKMTEMKKHHIFEKSFSSADKWRHT